MSHTWTLGPSTINQLRGNYVRQFGARVNNPTTSLADLNSKFTPQGDPTLPRLTVTGYFTGQTAIAGPDAGSNYTGIKDALSITKGKHSLKIGGDVSYEAIVHDTLLDNYGVFGFNGSKTGNAYADFLLGLPATMTQDAPIRKTDNGAYLSAVRAGRLPHSPARHAEPRPPLRRAVSVHRSAGPQARLRAGAEVGGQPDRPRRPALSRRRRREPRHRAHRLQQHRAAPRRRVGSEGRRPDGGARAFGMFYGSITGNEWNTTADNQPFTVRQSFPTVFTLSDPYRNLPGGVGPFPFNYTPGTPRFTLPAQVFGPSLDFVWPLSYQTNLTVEKELGKTLQRDRLVRRVARAESRRRASTTTIRCSGRPRRRRTSTRGGRICPARSARPPCCRRSSAATTTAFS